MILFTGGGGSASVHARIPQPLLGADSPHGKSDPPGKETPLQGRPLWQGDPATQCTLGDTVNKRAVFILLECNSCCVYCQVKTDGVMRQISFSPDGSPVSSAYDVVMLGDAGWETVSSFPLFKLANNGE